MNILKINLVLYQKGDYGSYLQIYLTEIIDDKFKRRKEIKYHFPCMKLVQPFGLSLNSKWKKRKCKIITCVYSCNMSLCLASFWLTELAADADAAHRLMESLISSSFSSKDCISISMDFHDLLGPTVGDPLST